MIPLTVVCTQKKELDSYLKQILFTDKELVIRMTPKKEEFSIDQIKEIVKDVAVFQPFKRVYILEDFHLSSLEAQNAFLKTLEEAPSNVQFILCVSNFHKLLPTVISRTKIIYLTKAQEEILNEEIKKKLTQFIQKPDLSLLSDKQFTATSKSDSIILLHQMILFFRERFLVDTNAAEITREIIRIKNLMENNNINNQLAIDNLLIFIQKKYSMK